MGSLSVGAKEFIPLHQKSDLSVNVPEFVPQRRIKTKNQLDVNTSSYKPCSKANSKSSIQNASLKESNENRSVWVSSRLDVLAERNMSWRNLQPSLQQDVPAVTHLKMAQSTTSKDSHKENDQVKLSKSNVQKKCDCSKEKDGTSLSHVGKRSENSIPLWSSIVQLTPTSDTFSSSHQRNSVSDKNSIKFKQKSTEKSSKVVKIHKNNSSNQIVKSKIDYKNSKTLEKNKHSPNPTTVHVKKKLTRTFGNAPFTTGYNVKSAAFYTAANEAVERLKSESNFISKPKENYNFNENKHLTKNNSNQKNNKSTIISKNSLNSQLQQPLSKKDSKDSYRVEKHTKRKQSAKTSKTKMSFAEYLKNDEKSSQPTAMSYSAVLKKATVNKPLVHVKENPSNRTENESLTLEEIIKQKKKRKSEKRKMKIKKKKAEQKLLDGEEVEEKEKVVEIKQSEKDIKLDMSDLFDQLIAAKPKDTQINGKKKLVVSTGVVSVVSGLAKKNAPNGKWLPKKKNGNIPIIMDGATAIRKRGKERETPKKKKPTLMKKVINAERERMRKLREKENTKPEELAGENINPSNENVTKEVFNLKRENSSEEMIPTKEEIEIGNENCGNEQKPLEENVENNAKEELPYKPLTHLPEEVWKKVHSRKFREYCNHFLSKDINGLTINLLKMLQKFQDRVYHETPLKYKQKRRFALGLREVLKNIKVKKIKAVIVAPNMERIQSEGGIDNYLSNILFLCEEQNISKIFALNRHVLGRVLKKKAPVSIVGIFSYDGAQDIYKELIQLVEASKTKYIEKVNQVLLGLTEQDEKEIKGEENAVVENSESFLSNEVYTIENNYIYNYQPQTYSSIPVDSLPCVPQYAYYYSNTTIQPNEYINQSDMYEHEVRERILSSLKS